MDRLQVMTKSIRNDFQEKTYQQFQNLGFPNVPRKIYWTPEAYQDALLTPVVNKELTIESSSELVLKNGICCEMPSIDGVDISVVKDVDTLTDCKFNIEHSSISYLTSVFFDQLIVVRCSKVVSETLTIRIIADTLEKQCSVITKVVVICEENSS